MRSFGQVILAILVVGIGPALCAKGVCKTASCPENTYCQELPENEADPYMCIDIGYLLGNCSMNHYLTCAEETSCIENPAGTTFKCKCDHKDALGNGIKTALNGSGCPLEYRECKSLDECPDNAKCDIDAGRCFCKDGFEGSGINCTDIIDCPSPICDPNAKCRDYPGGFNCTCKGEENFVGNGTHCQFKCNSDESCHSNAKCNDESLCECKPGYSGNGTVCEDIDQCADEDLNDCPDGSYCTDEDGGFKCTCKNGYLGDGKKCERLPTTCDEVEKKKMNKGLLLIDPDGTGPASRFLVSCQVDKNGVVLTKLLPEKDTKWIRAGSSLDFTYNVPKMTDINALLENSAFCYQDTKLTCKKGFSFFPGGKWFDRFGQVHENWGSSNNQSCTCGDLGTCRNVEKKCNCDGSKWAEEKFRHIDKTTLPVTKVQFKPKYGNANRGKVYVSALVCSQKQIDMPKNCQDAKINYNIKEDGHLRIDPDGDGPLQPFLVNCDMKTIPSMGITEISPSVPEFNIQNAEGETVTYNMATPAQIEGLINGSVFCSQQVEFDCQKSALLGNSGGRVLVGSSKRRLDYFPGANGVQGACGCGATKSCESPEVTCNCNIGDGVARKDFGLIINKEDLPVVHLTGQYGDQKTSTYSVSPIRCSGTQFGIEPNCERLRASGKNKDKGDYTYLIDPDGPGKLDPFLAECKFSKTSPEGRTYLHHTQESAVPVGDTINLDYLGVSPDQIDALKKKSTYCSQNVKVDCNKLKLLAPKDIIEWEPTNQTALLSLLDSLLTCTDGNGCNCNGVDNTNDNGKLVDLASLPVKKIDMSKIKDQLLNGASGAVTIGPLVCSEVFRSCNHLKQNSVSKNTLVKGKFTLDPDGAGGVEPFAINCKFPTATTTLTPDRKTYTTDESLNGEQCFDIQYRDVYNNLLSSAQMDAVVKSASRCSQSLTLDCVNAPATGKVSFYSCDGKKQPGWGDSRGNEGCACGVTGICDGGPKYKCNCDVGDSTTRTDTGTISDTNRLPVCKVCLSIPMGNATLNSKQTFTVGALNCDAPKKGYSNTCHDHSYREGRNVDGTSKVLQKTLKPKIQVACKFYTNPSFGSMLVNPKVLVYPPVGESPMEVSVTYFALDMKATITAMKKNKRCRQKIFFFCVGAQTIETGSDTGYYDQDGFLHNDWEMMPSDTADIQRVCEENKALCDKCGDPVAYVIKNSVNDLNIPVKIIKTNLKGVTLVVDPVECFKLYKSCQEVADVVRYPKTGGTYVLDPDGLGELFPFSAKCHFHHKLRVGTTEVELEKSENYADTIKDQGNPGQFEIPIKFSKATSKQAKALTSISDFCWQNVRYECKESPLLNNGKDLLSYYYLNSSSPSTSFGTGDKLNVKGCACGILGTCVNPDVNCNCNANGSMMAVDQGAVTDANALPISQINVGGQTAGSEVKVIVSSLQCGKLPVTPPVNCEAGRLKEKAKKTSILYTDSGEYLISPDPANVKPFMVYCDYNMLPGKAVTVVKPDFPTSKSIIDPTQPQVIPYKGLANDQIEAIIKKSDYCYQGVKIECQGSKVFAKGADWVSGFSATKNVDHESVCFCGKDNKCGGKESFSEQKKTKCNCDIGDDFPRKDSGIISEKTYLPVSKFVFGNGKLGNVNITVGDLICSQSPIKFNECELGFHDCHPKAKCVDLDDGYKCVCQEGWSGKTAININDSPRSNGRECIDDNECTLSKCSHESDCTNTPGSFYCTCHKGYRLQNDGLSCYDIDECKENIHDCHENAVCENLSGRYRCACKKGYKGDGKKICKAVGECKCFGDPHCLSFDSNWVHYQGLCEYVLSKDNCQTGDEPTYQVWAKYWRKGSSKPGYYSYIESVRIRLSDLEIKLVQNRGIQVNGILVDQYVNPDGVTAIKYHSKVVVKAPNGLEVQWDGKDAVNVLVPDSKKSNTCGMCGNYNGDPKDDWIVGESCKDKEGTLTDNLALFGNSWTVTKDSEVQCDIDCDPVAPPSADDCDNQAIINFECDRILDKDRSPFKKCLGKMTEDDIKQFKMSCTYDLCFVEHDFSGAVCSFAETLNKECTEKYKTITTEWRKDVDACETVECENNLIYKTCGPNSQESCFSSRVNFTSEESPDDCYEGCFCAEGLVMEANKCIPKDNCGCLYNNQYIKKGDVVVNADCMTKVKCEGGDKITSSPVSCGQNEKCSIGDDGKVSCYCEEGFMLDGSGTCVVDPCYNVTCPKTNTECHDGVCRCNMGFIGNCDSCANIDECATNRNICNKLGQKCTDIPGSYYCECKAGFVPDKNGNCKDIDECTIVADQCGDNSECANTLGGYSCECCAGYKKGSDGTCIRDPSLSKEGKCCACSGEKCKETGKVCGSDGKTYNDYRSLAVTACRRDQIITVEYDGECQATCETVKCNIPYQTCKPDAVGKPRCSCPTCNGGGAETKRQSVCATNRVTYSSICHMKSATCEAGLEEQVNIESVGQPCGSGYPVPTPGPWSDWGGCSESCKQGVMKRTREVYGNARASNEETAPCYSTCANGPCTLSTCKLPGQVCTADMNNVTSCACPICNSFPEQLVCGRIGVVIQTFDNPCILQQQACEAEADYELLEPRACEDKPQNCGMIREFKLIVDENGCKADRTLNVGACYGGCGEVAGKECCYPTKKEKLNLIMTCPDGSYYRKLDEYAITECSCISNEEADNLNEMEMNVAE